MCLFSCVKGLTCGPRYRITPSGHIRDVKCYRQDKNNPSYSREHFVNGRSRIKLRHFRRTLNKHVLWFYFPCAHSCAGWVYDRAVLCTQLAAVHSGSPCIMSRCLGGRGGGDPVLRMRPTYSMKHIPASQGIV